MYMDMQHINDQAQLEEPQALQQTFRIKFKAICIKDDLYVLGMNFELFVWRPCLYHEDTHNYS